VEATQDLENAMARSIHFFAFAFALCTLVSGCNSSQKSGRSHKAPPATETLEPYQCGSVQRLHTYKGIFLASQPAPEDFDQAKRGGIKTVINLRHPAEQKDFDERQRVTVLGLAYHNPAWDGPDELTDAKIDEVRNLLRTSERPILLHCSSANRVGAIWIAYRTLDDGATLEAAVAEAKTIGIKSPDYERIAKDYVVRHQK